MSRATRAVSQLVVALFAAVVVALALAAVTTGLAMAGHALPSDTPPATTAPVSFWPCPPGENFTEHRDKWGCFK